MARRMSCVPNEEAVSISDPIAAAAVATELGGRWRSLRGIIPAEPCLLRHKLLEEVRIELVPATAAPPSVLTAAADDDEGSRAGSVAAEAGLLLSSTEEPAL